MRVGLNKDSALKDNGPHWVQMLLKIVHSRLISTLWTSDVDSRNPQLFTIQSSWRLTNVSQRVQLRKFCLPLQCVIRKRSFQESVFAQIMARGAVTVTASCNRKLTANKAECSLWLCLSTLQTSHMFLHTKDDTDSHGDMLHWPLRTSYFHTLHPLLPISYSYFLLKHHTELLYGHLLTITSVLATVRHSRQVSPVCRQSETDGA